MMLLLHKDITPYPRYYWFWNRNCPILCLPAKLAAGQLILIYPKRGLSFY